LKNNLVNSGTIPAFLIGHPVAHSLSPIFQNNAFKSCGINSIYLALDVKPENFFDVMTGLKKIKTFGLNVTLPYKMEIIKHIDKLSDEAKEINSVNTVEIDNDNRWIGHNTDWYGVYKTLEINKIDKKMKVLLIGAGGAAPGTIYGLIKYGIKEITITNRTVAKALQFKNQFSIKSGDYQNLKNIINEFDLIINCTTLDFMEILNNNFNDKIIYFDLKYYLKKPKIKNYIDGSLMLLYQGARSFSIWTKKEAPVVIMKKTFKW
jgi:shikimate dehydrogenase